MTDEQSTLFAANLDLANRAAGKYRILGEDEESIRQDALIGLRKAVLTHEPARGPFEPFAWQVIRNQLHSAYRSAQPRQVELPILDENLDELDGGDSKKDQIPDREPTPSHETERNEIREALQDGLAALTPSQKSVLEHYASGGSFAEVARETGASEQAVRQMFQRGVNQLRPHMESRGVCGTKFMPQTNDTLWSDELVSSSRLLGSAQKPPEFKPLWTVLVLAIFVTLVICMVWIVGFFR